MPITLPNYNRKSDRHQFGTLIGIAPNPQREPALEKFLAAMAGVLARPPRRNGR